MKKSQADVLSAVREFNGVDKDNDPYDEHDFGAVDIAGENVFWKIDVYDKTMEFGSPDPQTLQFQRASSLS